MNGDYIQLQIEADALLAQKKLGLATETYSKYCESVAHATGSDSIETADALFQYGNCLLELARSESTVLGEEAPLPGVSDEGFDDVDEESTEEIEEMGEGKDHAVASTSEERSMDQKESENQESKDDEKQQVLEENENADNDNDDANYDDNAQEEEPSNMQLAWEALDAARIIYTVHKSKAKLIDTLLSLADISLESGQWELAIRDMQDALELNYLQASDRKLAELYYKLSLALEYQGSLEEAKNAIKNCIQALELKLKELEANLTESAQLEKTEIEAFFPELIDRMSDIDSLMAAKTRVEDIKQELLKQTPMNVNDVSNLIKRKKETAESEDAPGPSIPSEKKMKITEPRAENNKIEFDEKQEQIKDELKLKTSTSQEEALNNQEKEESLGTVA